MSPPLQVDSKTSGFDPSTQDVINLALRQNGGIKRIESVMQQRLDEAGWSQTLREYVTKLLRSGEATTYDDCMAKVMESVNNGELSGGPDLQMPGDAKQGAAGAVRKEILPLVEQK